MLSRKFIFSAKLGKTSWIGFLIMMSFSLIKGGWKLDQVHCSRDIIESSTIYLQRVACSSVCKENSLEMLQSTLPVLLLVCVCVQHTFGRCRKNNCPVPDGNGGSGGQSAGFVAAIGFAVLVTMVAVTVKLYRRSTKDNSGGAVANEDKLVPLTEDV